jgi:hypothetical protein
MAVAEKIINGRISYVGTTHVAITALSDKNEELRTITVSSDRFSEVFDIDNASKTLLYQGTTTTVKTKDNVVVYYPSLRGDSIIKILRSSDGIGEDLPSLIQNADYSSNVQIGAALLYVPPSLVRVDKVSTTKRVPTIRSKGSIKSQTGHTDTKITMTLVFPNLASINDPDDGLRAIVAQFMKTPFVPIINDYLNAVYHIDAVCLHDITISTMPNFPRSLQAELTLLAFEYMVFMPQERSFLDTIDGDLFRWYYKKNLLDQNNPILKPAKRTDSGISFKYLPEPYMANIKSGRQEAQREGFNTEAEQAWDKYYKANTDLGNVNKAIKAMEAFIKGKKYAKDDDFIIYTPDVSEGFGETFMVDMAWVAIKLRHPDNKNISDPKPNGGRFLFYNQDWVYLRYYKGRWSKKKDELVARTTATAELEKHNIQNTQKQIEMYTNDRVKKAMVPWEMDYEDVIVTDVTVAYQNLFARLPLQNYEMPGFQFLGSQDVYAKITLEVLSEGALHKLQELYSYSQKISREYGFDLVASFLGIKNDLLQLLGVEFVFIDSISCSTVPNFPGRYIAELTLMDFDVCQKQREMGEIITSSGNEVIIKSDYNLQSPDKWKPGYIINFKQSDELFYWTKLESILGDINLYPDLDLPTYDEVDAFLKSIGRSKFKRPESAGKYVDPDFYFQPSFDLRKMTREVLERRPEIALYHSNNNTPDVVTQAGKDITMGDGKDTGKVGTKTKEEYFWEAVAMYDKSPKESMEKARNKTEAIKKKMQAEGHIYFNMSHSKAALFSNMADAAQAAGYKVHYPGNYGTRAMISKPKELQPKQLKPEAVGYGPEGKNAQSQWTGEWTDQTTYERTGTMARAFPTCHMFFVDEGEKIGWYRLWDNFYGTNAICSMEIVRSRKIASDTAFITVANTYQKYMDRKVNFKKNNNKIEFNLGKLFELSINSDMKAKHATLKDHMSLFPGARLHIRLGYGNNLSALPITFNGTVTEINVNDIMMVVAQSDSIELTNVLNFKESDVGAGAIDWFNLGANPSKLLIRLMARGDQSGFRNVMSVVKSNWMEDSNSGVVHFGHPEFFAGLVTEGGELAQNIYPGNGTGLSANSEFKVPVLMHNKTIWDIAQLMSMYVPNYIAAVHPFEFRSTLFYGKPHWDLTYGYDISATGKGSGWTKAIDSKNNFLGYYLKPKKKPYRQWHLYSSYGHILDNKIKTTSEGMYQNVIVNMDYSNQLIGPGARSTNAPIIAYADQDIYAHIQRTTTVHSQLYAKMGILQGTFNVDELCLNLGSSLVRDYMKDMYQGEVLVIGDPGVKPYDAMYVADSVNEMFGACYVKQVVHQFSLDTGFVTSVSPDCAVGVIESEELDLLTWGASAAVGSLITWKLTCAGANTFKYKTLMKAGEMLAKGSGAIKRGAAFSRMTLGRGAISSLLWQAGTSTSAAATATTAAAAAGPPGWLVLLVAGVITVGVKALTKKIELSLKSQQTVVANFLTIHGSEFSAGVNGHKGLVIGTVGGKTHLNWWDRILQMVPDWALAWFDLSEMDLSPKMLYGENVPYAPVLFGEPTTFDERFKQKCVDLTGSFETGAKAPWCYGVTAGNFDGAGLSYGVLQWNFGSGTLQPIMKTMFAKHKDVMKMIFKNTDDYNTFYNVIMKMNKKQQIDWGNSISSGTTKRGVIEPWKTYFRELGRTEEMQAIQKNGCKYYMDVAIALFRDYGLQSERGFALCFDIAVQGGGIGSKPSKETGKSTKDLIMEDFAKIDLTQSPEEIEVAKMRVMTMRRSAACKKDPNYKQTGQKNEFWIQDDFRNRKGCIAFGKADNVHGIKGINLEKDFNITLNKLEM